MGQYGHAFDNFIEQRKEDKQNIVIEIYVCSELYTQLQEEGLLETLHENIRGTVTLKDNDKTVKLFIRDISTMGRAAADKGQHGCSIKVTEPKSIVGKGVDIIIPTFQKTGEAPYTGAKVPGEFGQGIDKAYVDPHAEKLVKKGKTYPQEILTAIKFGTDFKKELNLIYYKPDNERNQIELLKQIIKKCNYIDSIKFGTNVDNEKLNDMIDSKKEKGDSKK